MALKTKCIPISCASSGVWKLDYRRLRRIAAFYFTAFGAEVGSTMRCDAIRCHGASALQWFFLLSENRCKCTTAATVAPPVTSSAAPHLLDAIQTIEKIQKCVPEDEKWETEPRSVTRHLVSIYVLFPYRIVIIGRRDCIMHAPRTVGLCWGRLAVNGFLLWFLEEKTIKYYFFFGI